MGEPPGSEGRVVKPPPVPRKTAQRPPPPPGGPKTLPREAQPQSGEESTQRVAAPQDFGFVDEIMEILSAEGEALLTGARRGDPDALLADMNLRLAMLAWDLTDDRDGAARFLELAEHHPLAPRLILAQALASGSSEQLEAAQAVIQRLSDGAQSADRALLMRDLAEAWLYRFSSAEQAAECAREALGIAAQSGPPDLAIDLHHTLCLALAMAQEWPALVDALVQPPTDPDPASLAEAIHVLVDRLDDRERAAEIILQTDKASPEIAFYLAGLTVEIGLADPAAPPSSADVGDALAQRLALLETDPGAARDAAATRFLLVQHLAAMGDTDGALSAVAPLTASIGVAEGDSVGWGVRIAIITRYFLLLQKAMWGESMDLMRELADRPGAGRMAIAYRRRAAELADTRAAQPARALELWRQIFTAAGDEQSERAIEGYLLDADPAGLLQHLETQARRDRRRESAALRRASAVAETHCRDQAGALRLRRAAMAADGDSVVRHDDLVRLVRAAGERGPLAELYAEIAKN